MNELIGFTNDGKVFMTLMVALPDGKRGQTTLSWTPNEAAQLIEHLTTALKRLEEKSLIVAPNGLHL